MARRAAWDPAQCARRASAASDRVRTRACRFRTRSRSRRWCTMRSPPTDQAAAAAVAVAAAAAVVLGRAASETSFAGAAPVRDERCPGHVLVLVLRLRVTVRGALRLANRIGVGLVRIDRAA